MALEDIIYTDFLLHTLLGGRAKNWADFFKL